MQLSDQILYRGIEGAPQGPEHVTVWHLCSEAAHLDCCRELGQLALVTEEPPDIPNIALAGLFLMRLHPLAAAVQPTGEGFGVWLPATRSFPHSTVWHVPRPPKPLRTTLSRVFIW